MLRVSRYHYQCTGYMNVRWQYIIAVCQASKLRGMLQEWERSSEDYHEQLNTAAADRERLQSHLDQMSSENTR